MVEQTDHMTSTRTISGSMCPVQRSVVRASTPPDWRSASRTCRPASWCPARTSAARSRTGPPPCRCCDPSCWSGAGRKRPSRWPRCAVTAAGPGAPRSATRPVPVPERQGRKDRRGNRERGLGPRRRDRRVHRRRDPLAPPKRPISRRSTQPRRVPPSQAADTPGQRSRHARTARLRDFPGTRNRHQATAHSKTAISQGTWQGRHQPAARSRAIIKLRLMAWPVISLRRAAWSSGGGAWQGRHQAAARSEGPEPGRSS